MKKRLILTTLILTGGLAIAAAPLALIRPTPTLLATTEPAPEPALAPVLYPSEPSYIACPSCFD